MTKILFK